MLSEADVRFLPYILAMVCLVFSIGAAGADAYTKASLYLMVSLALAWYACHRDTP
jgi:hypothetical protein